MNIFEKCKVPTKYYACTSTRVLRLELTREKKKHHAIDEIEENQYAVLLYRKRLSISTFCKLLRLLSQFDAID